MPGSPEGPGASDRGPAAPGAPGEATDQPAAASGGATGRAEDVQATFVATLVDEWVRGGVRAAVVCPGSRSTPLALALAGNPGITVHVHHDERSGAFMALGLALASGTPVAVVTTSGTATAELHPAVVEAHHAQVPLLVCTADRPPELRDVEAPQTIDQAHLYGGAVRWFGDPGVADAASAGRWRAFASRALAETLGPPAGPVQLNLPFREPFVGTAGPLPPPRGSGPWTALLAPGTVADAAGWPVAPVRAATSRPHGESVVGGRGGAAAVADATGAHTEAAGGVPQGPRVEGGPAVGAGGGPAGSGAAPVHAGAVEATGAAGEFRSVVPAVLGRLAGRRGLLVAGEGSGRAGEVLRLAGALGWPVVADPRAEAWTPSPHVVAHLDGILRSDTARAALRPDVILRLGAPLASRVVNEWLTASGAEQIVVGNRWSDPDAAAAVLVRADPAWCAAALAQASPSVAAAPGMWLAHWQAVGHAAAAAVAATLDETPGPNEPAVARTVVAALPDGAQLVVSSSMPIRDVERYAVPRPGIRMLANRGANGIDGVVSTSVGAALAGLPTALLIGDIAFLHDSNGLLGLAGRSVDLVIVVVDNDGGGIFSFLPQAAMLPPERFETLFGTPHGLDLAALASAYGAEARTLAGDLGPAVAEAIEKGGTHVLVVRTDRAANVEVHRAIDDAVASAVTTALS